MIDISFASSQASGDVILAPFADGKNLGSAARDLDAASGGQLAAALELSRKSGKPGDLVDLAAPLDGEMRRVMLFGVGGFDSVTAGALERGVAGAVRALLTSGATSAVLRLDDMGVSPDQAARAALACALAAYRFDRYRPSLPAEKAPTLTGVQIVCDAAEQASARWTDGDAHVAAGVALARDLVNEPPNILHPGEFAARAQALGELGVEVEVLGEAEMAKLGMNALLGVGRGSEHESRLAVMRWNGGGDAAPIGFVGKGVTFDTGGISLKPGAGMDEMRGDMGGAAAVTGLMRAVAGRKAKANVVGVIGLVENMPDGRAQRPGDIVTTMSGKTVEILNTDAEGRLVLADALWYCRDRFAPSLMVDLATLTGAMIIALGHEHAGLFANDDALAERLTAAGLRVDEPVWRMPLGKGYDKLIDTPNADMKNIGGRDGGSITAAQFLQRFVDDTPWAHLDIAPTAWRSKTDDPRQPSWGTGWGVRVLDAFIAEHHEG